jgi:hypothetical protein
MNVFYGTDRDGLPNAGWDFHRDQPDARAVCAACHLPSVAASSPVVDDPIRATGVDRAGIHCDFCHKISGTEFTHSLDSLGLQHGRDALKLARPPAGRQVFFGPLDDVDRGRDTFSPLYSSSYYCASCHEGTLFGMRAYETFSEWQASPYAERGIECQSCHMRPDGRTKNVAPGHGGIDRDPATLSTHHFPGSNDADFLRSSVALSLSGWRSGGLIHAVVTVRPIEVGHRLPTGSPERHLILSVRATSANVAELSQVQGPMVPEVAGKGPRSAGNLSGMAGKIYGKVLRGPFGVPAPFWLATEVERDSRLYADTADETSYAFQVEDNSQDVRVTAALVYRRFYKALSEAKGWPDSDVLLHERELVLRVADSN